LSTRSWIALIAIYFIWGSTYLGIRLAIQTIPPFLMVGMRYLVSGAVIYSWRRLRGDPVPTLKQWRSASIIGLLLLMGGNGALAWAEQRIPTGIASLFIATVPLWMVLLDAFRPGGRRSSWLVWVGVLVGLVGTILLANPWQTHTSSPALYTTGIIVLIAAALSWSIGSLYSRAAPLPSSPLLGTGMEMLAGSAGVFILGSLLGEWRGFSPVNISMESWAGLAYLVVFGSGIGFVAYTWLLRNAPTATVSTYAYVNPVVAILLGTLLLHEPLETIEIISAAVIIAGVVLITTAKSLSARKVPRNPAPPSAD
jgi:drug/metabolite transporter (DMT)-like permease